MMRKIGLGTKIWVFCFVSVGSLPASGQEAQLAYVRPAEIAGDSATEAVGVASIPDQLRKEFELNEFYQKVAVLEGIPIVGLPKSRIMPCWNAHG